MSNSLMEFWSTRSALFKLTAIIVLVVIVGASITSTRSCMLRSRDERFDRREAEHAQEREEWQREREQAIGRAMAAEAAARDAEAKRAIYESLLNSLGARAEELKAKAENEDQKFVEEMQRIGVDIDAVARCERICARLAIKKEDCNCH